MLKEFNNLTDYIERHLTEEISGEDISKIVGVSDYHFKRMFSYMAGMSLSEYIKNRRLSVANVELMFLWFLLLLRPALPVFLIFTVRLIRKRHLN